MREDGLPTSERYGEMASKTQKATKDEAGELPRCQCGCGTIRNPKSMFVIGHDAKLKSRLLAQWDAGQGADAEELVERGWYSWEELEARRQKIEAKAEAKAAAKVEPTVEAEPAAPAAKPRVARGRKAHATTQQTAAA
jgi:hypothetical protein